MLVNRFRSRLAFVVMSIVKPRNHGTIFSSVKWTLAAILLNLLVLALGCLFFKLAAKPL